MGTFWADAQGIFDTASQASIAGSPDCDVAIVIGAQGQIRMTEANGWSLPGLAAEHGAQAVYRVTRRSGTVRLEGRSAGRSCRLESESPAASIRRLLACGIAQSSRPFETGQLQYRRALVQA